MAMVTTNIVELLTLTLISFYDLLSYDSARVVHRRRGVKLHSLRHIILNNVDTKRQCSHAAAGCVSFL
jgi:hypothetical protein